MNCLLSVQPAAYDCICVIVTAPESEKGPEQEKVDVDPDIEAMEKEYATIWVTIKDVQTKDPIPVAAAAAGQIVAHLNASMLSVSVQQSLTPNPHPQNSRDS